MDQKQKQAVSVLNQMLADLANTNTSSSGHTAAAVLDQWRAITLGGGWGEVVGGARGAGKDGEAGAGAVITRHSRPTEVRKGGEASRGRDSLFGGETFLTDLTG